MALLRLSRAWADWIVAYGGSLIPIGWKTQGSPF